MRAGLDFLFFPLALPLFAAAAVKPMPLALHLKAQKKAAHSGFEGIRQRKDGGSKNAPKHEKNLGSLPVDKAVALKALASVPAAKNAAQPKTQPCSNTRTSSCSTSGESACLFFAARQHR